MVPQTVPQAIYHVLNIAPFQMVNYLSSGLEDCFLNKSYVFLDKYIYRCIISKYNLSEHSQQTITLFKVLTQDWDRGEG